MVVDPKIGSTGIAVSNFGTPDEWLEAVGFLRQ